MHHGSVRPQQALGQAQHPCAVGCRQHDVGETLERVDGVRHGDTDFTDVQQGAIVLGIADCDGRVAGDPHVPECLEEPCPFGQAGRKDHHFGAVEDQLAVEPEPADLLQHRDSVLGLASQDDLTGSHVHAAIGKRVRELMADGRGETTGTCRHPQDAAVLRDDRIDVVSHVREVGLELIDDPTGHQEDQATAGTQSPQGVENLLGGSHAVPGESPVEVSGQGPDIARHHKPPERGLPGSRQTGRPFGVHPPYRHAACGDRPRRALRSSEQTLESVGHVAS